MAPAHNYPGAFLASERQKRGIAIEQISNKLNLRTQVIAHLEADEYDQLPEAVFVQGYIRAYCKYLSIPADELVAAYVQLRPQDTKTERFLFQNPSNSKHRNEKILHSMTSGFVLVAVVSVSIWLYQNKSVTQTVNQSWRQSVAPQSEAHKKTKVTQLSKQMDMKVTDVTKMHELLTASADDAGYTPKDME